jgi:hypothetical protein
MVPRVSKHSPRKGHPGGVNLLRPCGQSGVNCVRTERQAPQTNLTNRLFFTGDDYYVLSRLRVTIHGYWIVDGIYWTFWYSASLQFTIHYYTYTHTIIRSHVFTSFCLVAASEGWPSPSSGIPNLPSLSYQNLTATAQTTEPQQFSNSFTDWLTHSPTKSTQTTLNN